MRHGCARWKRFGMFLTAGVLAVSAALPVFAGGGTLESGNKTTIDVSAYCEEPTYSVGLEWGSMEFQYQFGKGWNYEDSAFNQIKITNSSLAPVGVELDFDGNSGYTGTFNTDHDGKGTAYDALYLSARESMESSDDPSGSMYLILKGERPTNTEGQKIGTITIELVDVIDSNLDEFENKHGMDKIGHITRYEGLVSFNRSNLER